jgi:adenine-specific DNA-methyltransferase
MNDQIPPESRPTIADPCTFGRARGATREATPAVPIRYMGTKRHLAHHVRRLVDDLKPKGKVVDLFSGMGCVSEELAGLRSVVTNDALEFTAALARARFTGGPRTLSAAQAIERLKQPFRDHVEHLAASLKTRLREEQRALDGTAVDLQTYMASAEHVANSERVERKAKKAAKASDADRYCLATLYFSAGYFGLRQAIHLDALRDAIDQVGLDHADRDWLLAGWLSTAANIANAPGHTAQYLKPNTEAAHARIRRYWRRNVWSTFQDRLIDLTLVGTPAWRARNEVRVTDALDLLVGGDLKGVGAIYADPPYTKDQYSRYYHVYETLYRYDFPDASGEGRTRSDRFSTGFSLKTGVVQAFTDLFDGAAALKLPLILSYPSAGLLVEAGSSVPTLAAGRMTITATETFGAQHSTLGASQGSKTKSATENLYVCRPA